MADIVDHLHCDASLLVGGDNNSRSSLARSAARLSSGVPIPSGVLPAQSVQLYMDDLLSVKLPVALGVPGPMDVCTLETTIWM